MNSPKVVGRLAPSPTGALHLGNARSFLLAWLSARQRGGQVILRIEDIDSPRVKPWALAATIEDLSWLGLDWDIGPDKTSQQVIQTVQTQRLHRYEEMLSILIEAGKVYPCTCTRSEVAEAASAPHETLWQALEGTIYPGTCRPASGTSHPASTAKAIDAGFAYRWAFDDGAVAWYDELHGPQSANPLRQLGDFVIAKSTGTPAYQLAVIVDDFDMGVTEVVRGDDLLASTYRQLAISRYFGWPTPTYYHVPLIIGPDGKRLAKRHGDTRLSCLRKLGVAPTAVVGFLAWTLQLTNELGPATAESLIGQLQWSQLPKSPTTFELAASLPKLHELS